METALHIASLLVHCRPQWLDAVKANLGLLPGVEHERDILATLEHIQQLPGVLNAALIYHEELLSLEGEAP